MTTNTLTKHCDEKILMLSSSVVCLSLTILNIFENKKGIIGPSKKTNVSRPCLLHFLGPPLFFYYLLLVFFFFYLALKF